MSNYNSDFECTPEQYHANLSRLWEAIGNPKMNGEDVFTRVVGEIEKLRQQKADLLEALESVANESVVVHDNGKYATVQISSGVLEEAEAAIKKARA